MAQKNQYIQTVLKILRKSIPFLVLLLVVFLVILPLGKKIRARKQAQAEARASQARTQAPLPNVATLRMTPKLIMEKLSFPGVAKPWVTLEVVSEVQGKIVQKRALEGHRVKRGDILALVDPRDYQNDYDAALADFETAQIAEKRLKALSGKKFVTQSNLDEAVSRVKTTRAILAKARLNLDRCAIRSPMDGVVDGVKIERGSYLTVGDPVYTLLRTDKVKVEVGIPESDVDAVRRLKTFQLTLDALDNRAYTGTYHHLTRTTTSLARLYTLDIEVKNLDQAILPDMFSRVEIVKHQDPQGLAVPLYALVTRRGQKGVFVENQGRVKFTPVSLGFQDGWEIQVTQGLAPGDAVVVVGHGLIEDGEAVRVIQTVDAMEELNQ